MGNRGKRWWLEVTEIEGRCQASVGYSYMPGRTVVWDSTTWTLPATPLSMEHMLGELQDVLLVLMEQRSVKG